MRIKIEMENSKVYNINWSETLEFFIQEVQFSENNAFLLTDNGNYINMKKIVEFKPEI